MLMKVLLIKKACKVVFQSSKNENKTLPHEFIFVFIQYLLSPQCQKGVFKRGGNVYCVAVCVFFAFKPFLSVFFVFYRKGLSLVESNQQIHGFQKQVIFEKQRNCGPLQSIFLISTSYSYSVIEIAVVCAQQVVLICIHMRVSVYWSLSALRVLSGRVCDITVLAKFATLLQKTHSKVLLVLWHPRPSSQVHNITK